MLYYLLKYLGETYQITWLRLVDYISFRALAAAVTALLIALIFGERIIAYLKTKVIEPIKEEAPEEHRKKVGIPSMGGSIILLSIFGASLLWSKLASPFAWLILLAVAWMGIIGFIDDYLKVIKKVKGGLSERYKLFGQVTLGLAIGIYTVLDPKLSALLSNTTVPFFKNLIVDYGYWYIPVCVFIVAAVSNAVNLTDGLDGLAAGCSAITLIALAGFAYLTGNAKFAKYLNIVYIEGAGEVAIIALAIAAACIGFLWFNAHPAQVFMGDTGSLALGGALGATAVAVKHEIVLAIIGGLFVLEAVSVIVQVASFKLTGKRVFRMAPIHHHYEKKGWAEPTIVIRFWIIAIILALIGLSTLKLR